MCLLVLLRFALRGGPSTCLLFISHREESPLWRQLATASMRVYYGFSLHAKSLVAARATTAWTKAWAPPNASSSLAILNNWTQKATNNN
jgi:hypothetical protein